MISLQGTFPRLLVLLGFCLVLGGVFAMGSIVVAGPIFGIELESITDITNNLGDPENVKVLKFLQLFNTLGLFVLPAVLFALLFLAKPVDYLKLNKPVNSTHLFLVILLLYSLLPAINWLVEWNSNMQLPDFMAGLESWMKASEESAMRLTKSFLSMESKGDLIFNLFLIAVLPAIGEELIFRGIVQQTINDEAKSYHIGIWVSAILFSALHMQFYGFFPRMILGAFFGYLLHFSKTLWLPIFAHFLNNGTAVLIAYQMGVQGMEEEFDQIGVSDDTFIYSFVGMLVFSITFYFFYRNTRSSISQ